MFKLAELFVEIGSNLNPLNAGLAQARGKLTAFTTSANAAVSGASMALLGIGVAGGAAMAAGLWKGTQAAASLNESLSKVGAVFGPDAKAITDAADLMAEKFGSSKQVIIDAATETGILAQGIGGLANGPASEFGAQFVKMADDLVSFADVAGGVPEAMRAINSGLRGESEPMSRYGVILQEDQLKAEALRLGIAKLGKELTQQQKFTARASLIQTGLAKTKGDHERTGGSAKNVQREIMGRAANLLSDVGQAALPVWSEILTSVNKAFQSVAAFATGTAGQLKSWGEAGAGAVRRFMATLADLGASFQSFLGSESFGSLGTATAAVFGVIRYGAETAFGYVKDAIDLMGFGLRNFDDLAALAGVSTVEAFTHAGETIAWAAKVAEDFGTYLAGNWQSLATDAMNAVTAAVSNLGDNIKAILDALAGLARGEGFDLKLKPVLEGFNPTAAQFHVRDMEHSDYGDQKAEINKRIADRESGRKVAEVPGAAQPGGVTAPVLPSAPGGGPAAKAFKAETFEGGRDYSKALMAGALSAATKPSAADEAKAKTAKDQLAEAKKTNNLLEDISKGFHGSANQTAARLSTYA